MTKEDDKLLSEIETTITKHKQSKKAKEQKKIEKSQYATKEDLKGLLNQFNEQFNKGGPVDQQVAQPQQAMQPQQPQRRQLTEKEQIAMQIWRDSKATSIVCLIAIILPMISILVAMVPGGAMYALVLALAGIAYPCFVFVRMIGLQTRLHIKYGLKPMFKFPQQNIPQQRMQHNNRGKML